MKIIVVLFPSLKSLPPFEFHAELPLHMELLSDNVTLYNRHRQLSLEDA